MSELRVIGRAVAREKGYYPTPSGIPDSVLPGQEFDVVEGHPVKSWADVLPRSKPKAPASTPEGDAPPGDIA